MAVSEVQPTTVNVVGLGYVGAEICLAAVAAGHQVAAVDHDLERIASLRRPAPTGHDEWTRLRQLVASGDLDLYAEVDRAPPADVWVVAVPTPLGTEGKPDTSSIDEAARAIAAVVTANSVVVLESTSYPGTTEEIFLPPFLAAGWTPGVDLFVGFSPERIDPGNRDWSMRHIPKLVSGCTEGCAKAVADFYSTIVDTVNPMSSTRAAEMAKLFENSWRLVNIVLANENEALCTALGIDPWEVSEACRTKPFGYFGFDPGPGAGGHCVPVDARYLAYFAAARSLPAPVLNMAITANAARPSVIVRRVLDTVAATGGPSGRPRVLLIGVAYKADVADTRESASLAVLRELAEQDVEVDYHDPHVPVMILAGETRTSTPLTPATVATYDCVVVLTAHNTVDWSVLRRSDRPIIDTRNALAMDRE